MSARGHRRARCATAGFVIALLVAGVPAPSGAPPVLFTVTTTADAPDAVPGDGLCATAAAACTLRAALAEAATIALGAEITVPAGHYVVAAALEVAAGAVTIRGASRATTVLDADEQGRVFDVGGGAALVLADLTMTNGSTTEEGGAIRAFDAALTLDGVAVSTSATDGYGGGVFTAGSTVTILGSSFEQDTALEGGAVAVMGGDLTIADSTFTGCLATDAGGAVAAFGAATVTITDSVFTGNTAEHSGGALFLAGATAPGTVTVTGSTFADNQSFGGSGGAIAADGLVSPGIDGTLAVSGCTFTGNVADRTGGALAASLPITSDGNTFMDNAAPDDPDLALPVAADVCKAVGICNGFVINAFRCYQAKPAAGTAFAPIRGVRLADAAADVVVDLTKPRLLCAAADAGGDGLRDGATHLEGYVFKPLKGQPKIAKAAGLAITTPIGGLVLDTAKSDLMLTPTAMHPTIAPTLVYNQVDRFRCAVAKLAKGQPKLAKDLQLTVTDALTGLPRRVALKKVARLCAPVGEDGGAAKHADHLVCFQVSASKGRCADDAPVNPGGGCKKETECGGTKGTTGFCTPQGKLAKLPGIFVANDLADGRLDAAKEDLLCLPARRQ